jgi:hypothetical protein
MARFPTVVVCMVLAITLATSVRVGAEPQSAGATRPELARWLERLGATGTDGSGPLFFRYSFSAAATASLEALSIELVAAGYAIEVLAPTPGERAQLTVVRAELMTPAALERRNRDLSALAAKRSARYDGVDVAFDSSR